MNTILIVFVLIGACSAKTRQYYIQSEEILWNYAPGLTPTTENQIKFLENGPDRIGSTYKKCVYRRYTNSSFVTRHPDDDRSPGSRWEHLGTLGPVLRAVIGDTVFITYKNTCNFPASVHGHGIRYDSANEGSNYLDKNFNGGYVETGATFKYKWEILERTGPAPADGSTVAWLYHAHADEPKDTISGLVGIVIVGKNNEGIPIDVASEFVTMFSVIDENLSHYIDDNIRQFTSVSSEPEITNLKNDADFHESNLKHSINGYSFFTLPGVTTKINSVVRWYVLGMGSEVDIHTVHWHGDTVNWHGNRADVIEVFAGTLQIADMLTDNIGKWMIHCHVNDHIEAGMMGYYTVLPH